MKLDDFTIWQGEFGWPEKVSDTKSNFYPASVMSFTDKVSLKTWGKDDDFSNVDGDYKNNFVFIAPSLMSSEKKWDESRQTFYREQAFHIIEDYFFSDTNQNGLTSPYFPGRRFKTKIELTKYFKEIIGKNLFEAIQDGKFTLILDSHTELISMVMTEILLTLLQFVGLKNVCCLIYNTKSFKHPRVINWDYFLYDFVQDLKPIFQITEYFPLSESNIDYLSQYKKPKKFLSYNANLHGHRLFTSLSLFSRELDKYGLISMLNRSDVTKSELEGEMIYFFQYQHQEGGHPHYDREIKKDERATIDLLDKFYDKFPITLDIDIEFLHGDDTVFQNTLRKKYKFNDEIESKINQIRTDRFITIEHHLDTYFSVISETSINNQHSGWSNDELVHICEKTYKGLASPHPFILFANDGVLKYLKSLGFKTFPEMFDESYDEEKDTLKRFKMVLDEIEKLCKMDEKKLHQKFVKTLSNIKHNHNLLLSFDREELLLGILKEISNVGQ